MVKIVKETQITETTTSYKVQVDLSDEVSFAEAAKEYAQHRERAERVAVEKSKSPPV